MCVYLRVNSCLGCFWLDFSPSSAFILYLSTIFRVTISGCSKSSDTFCALFDFFFPKLWKIWLWPFLLSVTQLLYVHIDHYLFYWKKQNKTKTWTKVHMLLKIHRLHSERAHTPDSMWYQNKNKYQRRMCCGFYAV